MDRRSVGSESMSELSDFAVEDAPAVVEADIEIIEEEDSDKSCEAKIRRLVKDPDSKIRLIRDNA
eukprot:12407838-Karenia_brevis.AAC.1